MKRRLSFFHVTGSSPFHDDLEAGELNHVANNDLRPLTELDLTIAQHHALRDNFLRLASGPDHMGRLQQLYQRYKRLSFPKRELNSLHLTNNLFDCEIKHYCWIIF